MDKFLSDQRKLAFLGAACMALGPWVLGLASWHEAFTPASFGALLGIAGALFLSNAAGNIWKPPPMITVKTEPQAQTTVVTTTVTPPENK